MASLIDVLEKVMTLTSNVSDLKSNVTRIDGIVREHDNRITKLEAREEVIIEKSKSEAILVVSNFSNSFTEKMTDLKHHIKSLNPSSPPAE